MREGVQGLAGGYSRARDPGQSPWDWETEAPGESPQVPPSTCGCDIMGM